VRLSRKALAVTVAAGCCALSAFAQPVSFVDVTAEAGLDYIHWDPEVCGVDCHGDARLLGGVAAGDYDNDGWVDLYVTRLYAPNLLFHNKHDGTFEEVGAAAGVDVASLSSGCAWADVDNDGDLDLYVLTVQSPRSYLFINDGKGHFEEAAALYGIALADDSPGLWMGAAFGDYDLDGDLDLHIAGWRTSGTENRLFHNTGGPPFVEVTASAGLTLRGVQGFATGFADVTGDGWSDLLIAADFGTSQLLRNLRDGTFENITQTAGVGTDENGMGSAIGDVDNDGDLDWFVTSIYQDDTECSPTGCSPGWDNSGNRLYINDSTGHFSDGTDDAGLRDGGWGWGASFFDFDNDGDLDLGMTNGVDFPWTTSEDIFHDMPAVLWENNGAGVMTNVGERLGFTNAGFGKGFATLDYDRDGDVDVFIVNNADLPVLYENVGGSRRSWLQVDLEGRATNRFGVGALVRVQVVADGPVQMRLISANSNFMSQDEITAHFGLGEGVRNIHSVRIEWPVTAIIQTLPDVPANQRIRVTEPRLGDFDANGSVDRDDYLLLQYCLTGPADATAPEGCARAVTLRDVARFQNAFTGALE